MSHTLKAEKLAKPSGTAIGISTVFKTLGTNKDAPFSVGTSTLTTGELSITPDYDEVLFCHSGSLTISSGGEDIDIIVGDIIWVPKGSTLTYKINEPCELLYITHPAVHE